MMPPSARQMTPEPAPRPEPSTCTVERVTLSVVCDRSSIRAGCISVLSLRPFAHRNLHFDIAASSADCGFDALAHAIGTELRVYVVGVGNRSPVQFHQHVSKQHA